MTIASDGTTGDTGPSADDPIGRFVVQSRFYDRDVEDGGSQRRTWRGSA